MVTVAMVFTRKFGRYDCCFWSESAANGVQSLVAARFGKIVVRVTLNAREVIKR